MHIHAYSNKFEIRICIFMHIFENLKYTCVFVLMHMYVGYIFMQKYSHAHANKCNLHLTRPLKVYKSFILRFERLSQGLFINDITQGGAYCDTRHRALECDRGGQGEWVKNDQICLTSLMNDLLRLKIKWNTIEHIPFRTATCLS